MTDTNDCIISVPEDNLNNEPAAENLPAEPIAVTQPAEPVAVTQPAEPVAETQPTENAETIQDSQSTKESSENEKLISENVTEAVEGAGVVDHKLTVVIPSDSDPISKELEQIADEGLAQMVERYLDDGEIDNEELVDLVQYSMELVEKKRNLSGAEKKNVVLVILRKFLESRVNNWEQLEKLLSSTIDFSVSVAKNGINKVKITSATIVESKTAFNLIYSSTMSQIAQKYPEADDIVNNLFDIAKHILELIEGQTNLKESEKKVLIKKILLRTVDSLKSKLSESQQQDIATQIDSTVALIMIGVRAQKGEMAINIQEVMTIGKCLFGCFRKKK